MNVNRLAFAYGLYFPVLYARGEPVWRYLKSLEVTQWAPVKDIATLQERKLVKLLDSARMPLPRRGLPRTKRPIARRSTIDSRLVVFL